MKRPSFQFYPADWRSNAKLRRCSEAARGAWMDVLCVLHDSEEYGVLRWPLRDIAQAAGVKPKLLQELVDKDVLKGADEGAQDFTWAPTHAGKKGDPVVLVVADGGPCWYSSRFVRDEYVRQRRGDATRFDTSNQPPKATPKQSPKPANGEPAGDGASASSASSTTTGKAKATGQQAAQGGAAFIQFWNAYPLKKGKPAAMKAWPKAMTKTTLDELLTALQAQINGDDEWLRGFIPRASTYLNGEFWNDELAKPKPDMRAGPAINTAVPRGKPAEASESPLEAAILRAKHLRSMDAIDDDALQLEIQRVTALHRGEEVRA